MENPIKIDDLGAHPYFWNSPEETPIWVWPFPNNGSTHPEFFVHPSEVLQPSGQDAANHVW